LSFNYASRLTTETSARPEPFWLVARLEVGRRQGEVGAFVVRGRRPVVEGALVVWRRATRSGESLASCWWLLWHCLLSISARQSDAGRLSFANESRLVGFDVGPETVVVGHVLHMTIDAVCVSVSIRASHHSIAVALLLPVLSVSAVVLSVEIEGEGLGLTGWGRVHLLLLLNILFALLLRVLLLLLD